MLGTATAVIFPQSFPGEEGNLPLGLDCFQSAQDEQQGQNAADALAQEGGPGHAGHAHVKDGDKENIHRDVGGGRAGQEPKRRLGVAIAEKMPVEIL